MEMVPVKSSNVKAVGYADGDLTVEFVSGGRYVYHGVPAGVHAALMAAESKGAFVLREISRAYRFDRIRVPPPERGD